MKLEAGGGINPLKGVLVKRTAIDHPKIRRLGKMLGIQHCHAVGIMECLWQFTAKHAMAGDIGKWSDVEICDALGWPVIESEALFNALIDCRLIDRHDTFRLVVHDWQDHCEDFVHIALARRTEFFSNGTRPSLSRITKTERESLELEYQRLKPTGEVARTKTHRNAQPEPEPEPEPSLAKAKPEPEPVSPVSGGPDPVSVEAFVEAWNSASGNHRIRVMTEARIRKLRARLRDPPWAAAWQAALAKFPLKCFSADESWKPDIDWFLQPDSVLKILEGKYDWSKSHGNQLSKPGAGQRYVPGQRLGEV